MSLSMFVDVGRERQHARQPGRSRTSVVGRQSGHFTLSARYALEVVVEEILEALIDGTEMPGERAVLLAAQREEVIQHRSEAVGVFEQW